MAYLRIIDGPNSGQILEMKGPKCVLGRHPDCDIAVTGQDASRHHARIVRIDGGCFLEDLHSLNGTFLNDEPIRERREIADGDRISVADAEFTFHYGHLPDQCDRATLDKEKIRPILVDDDEQSQNVVFVSSRDATVTQDTSRSTALLQTQLKALLEITQNLRNSLTLERVLPQILDSLFVIFSAAERGFIVLQNETGVLEPRWSKLRRDNIEQPPRISRTIVHRAMDSQEAVLSADAPVDSRFTGSTSLSTLPIRSVMCAPLIDSDGDSFGVLQVDTAQDQSRFQQEDLEVLLSVAAQASIAIDNARLHEYALRQRAVERDLEVADQIQRSFLPRCRPELPQYEFFDYCRPANHVGGDFYQYLPFADGRMAVVVADVVGHGLAAAMLSANLVSEVRFRLRDASRPEDALTQLNAILLRDLVEDHFVTLVLAVLAPESGDVTIVNAGHMLPMFCRADGRVEDVGQEQTGLPLGVLETAGYRPLTIRLSSGESLVLYTDGVTDAANEAKQRYGIHRMRILLAGAQGTPRQLGQKAIDDARDFLGICPQEDDMCLVCFGRL
ncbi:MAG TPA: SpoIIE family protein phosphatase [Thermoguttaceae bacterium]|nr:SpoIIE family protein phosphatase [Thermoguttaceae bacterium]